MLARAHTFTIEDLHTRHVTVEVDIRAGLPAFTIVGLADTAVREARERIQAAILNSGYEFPARRITANLAPGDVRKAGAGLDLALACAVLAASGQLPCEELQRIALFGELGLDGSVRPVHGALAVAHTRPAIVLRPLATFVYNYIFRLGFLDGREGLLLHLYHAVYVSWKYAKAWELACTKEIR